MKKNKITVGLFVDAFYPMNDGVVMVVDNYARRLVKYCNVIVFAPRYINQDYDDSVFNYQVVRCRSLRVPFIDYSLPVPKMDNNFQNILKEYHLDIVHIHSPFTIGEAGIKYGIHHHIPIIGTMHSQYRQDFKRAVKTDALANTLTKTIIHTFNKCDECWAVNSEVARIFYEDYGYKCLPRIMNNATEMRPLANLDEARKLIDNQYNLTNEKIFLFVGRLNALKNIFFIVEALAIVRKEKPDLSFKMFFIGTGQDEEELKRLIQEKGLQDNIILCGKIVDRNLLAAFYARSDLFLFPSLYDASSIVQIEAASQKTPGLFIENAATASTVTDNVNGFIASNDVNDYAKKIIQIMSNKELLEQVGNNAFRDLYKNWDDSIYEVYERYLTLITKKNENVLVKKLGK